jgi:hypothetical protein
LVTDSTKSALKLQLAPEVKSTFLSPKTAVPF